MINDTINILNKIAGQLKEAILQDIEDVKKAEHKALLERNEIKQQLMNSLSSYKQKLNEELSQEYYEGKDITIYRDSIDILEVELKELYQLNGRLASIVLPVREMYRDIIDEITRRNGGSLVEVMA